MQILSNVHDILLRADSKQEGPRLRHAHRETCSICTTIVNHAALQIEQTHIGTNLCTRNLKATAIGNSSELRRASYCRNKIRTRIVAAPHSALANKDSLKSRNVIRHVFALYSATRQIFFSCYSFYNDICNARRRLGAARGRLGRRTGRFCARR